MPILIVSIVTTQKKILVLSVVVSMTIMANLVTIGINLHQFIMFIIMVVIHNSTTVLLLLLLTPNA